MSWRAPSGLSISQSYVRTKPYKIMMHYTKSRGMTIKIATNEINTIKQINAISPNFIYSFDATHVIKVIQASDQQLVTIHDSFGCLPNRMPNLLKIILTEFENIYADIDYQKQIHKDSIKLIEITYKIIKDENNNKVVIGPDEQKFIIPKLPDLKRDKIFFNGVSTNLIV